MFCFVLFCFVLSISDDVNILNCVCQCSWYSPRYWFPIYYDTVEKKTIFWVVDAEVPGIHHDENIGSHLLWHRRKKQYFEWWMPRYLEFTTMKILDPIYYDTVEKNNILSGGFRRTWNSQRWKYWIPSIMTPSKMYKTIFWVVDGNVAFIHHDENIGRPFDITPSKMLKTKQKIHNFYSNSHLELCYFIGVNCIIDIWNIYLEGFTLLT